MASNSDSVFSADFGVVRRQRVWRLPKFGNSVLANDARLERALELRIRVDRFPAENRGTCGFADVSEERRGSVYCIMTRIESKSKVAAGWVGTSPSGQGSVEVRGRIGGLITPRLITLTSRSGSGCSVQYDVCRTVGGNREGRMREGREAKKHHEVRKAMCTYPVSKAYAEYVCIYGLSRLREGKWSISHGSV